MTKRHKIVQITRDYIVTFHHGELDCDVDIIIPVNSLGEQLFSENGHIWVFFFEAGIAPIPTRYLKETGDTSNVSSFTDYGIRRGVECK